WERGRERRASGKADHLGPGGDREQRTDLRGGHGASAPSIAGEEGIGTSHVGRILTSAFLDTFRDPFDSIEVLVLTGQRPAGRGTRRSCACLQAGTCSAAQGRASQWGS